MIKDNYPDGICPDCSLDIPSNAVDGSECVNCGHIFYESNGTCEQCKKLGETTCGNDIDCQCFEPIR